MTKLTRHDRHNEVQRIERQLVDLRKMRAFLDHQERELTVELWEAREEAMAA